MEKETYLKNLELYENLIAMTPEIEQKGKTMPYTSANGHMFSQINKDGEIGIRLPKDKREEFLKKYETGPFKSYGAVMKEYVLIPENHLNQPGIVSSYLLEGYKYFIRGSRLTKMTAMKLLKLTWMTLSSSIPQNINTL